MNSRRHPDNVVNCVGWVILRSRILCLYSKSYHIGLSCRSITARAHTSSVQSKTFHRNVTMIVWVARMYTHELSTLLRTKGMTEKVCTSSRAKCRRLYATWKHITHDCMQCSMADVIVCRCLDVFSQKLHKLFAVFDRCNNKMCTLQFVAILKRTRSGYDDRISYDVLQRIQNMQHRALVHEFIYEYVSF